jgi:rSAM/selenodomain-associated transferase 1
VCIQLDLYVTTTVTNPRPEGCLEPAECCVALFARVPVPGKVKTRLVPALGEEGACLLHSRLLERTLGMLAEFSACSTCLWLDQAASGGLVSGYGGPVYVQQGEELGARLAFASARMLESFKAVIIIGTDCPALDAGYLANALQLLQAGKDVVLGPATDGGYVLIGTRSFEPLLFRNIDWGTGSVLAQTLSAAMQTGLEVGMLPELADVDRPEDLELPEIRELLA